MLPQPESVQVEVTAAAEVDAHQEEEDSQEEEVKRDKPDSEVSRIYFTSVEPISAQEKAIKRADYLLFITSKC